MDSINLFEVLPDTFIQESLATREQYENLDTLYELDNEIRLSLLDLLKLNKLKLFYGVVYSFGNNEDGQLGTGDTDHKAILTQINYSMVTDINGTRKRVIQVSTNLFHSLILCKDGSVLSFGIGGFGQLGTGNIDNVTIPTAIITSNMGGKRVIQVSAGGHHSLLLCDDGSVFSFGWNHNGQLGVGNINNDIITIPTLIDTTNIGSKRVIQVSAGGRHSLLLCEDGTVYVFGQGEYGQLGTGNTDDVTIPTPINTSNIGEKRVIQVSAGYAHSLILCEDGTVYSFGNGNDGKLGIGNTDNVAIPTLIDTSNMLDNIGKGKRVIQISAGGDHSLILCEDGTIFSFGFGEYGQLGTGNTDDVAIPTPIITSKMDGKRVIQVSAGGEHSLLLCEDGTVFSFGNGRQGLLGTGNTYNIPIPVNTSNLDGKVIQIAAGDLHFLLLT